MKDLNKKIIFSLLFIVIGYAALQVPLSQLIGSNVRFSVFDFVGPIAGAFLGPIFGVISVALVQTVNLGIHHTHLDTFTEVRFVTALFATLYFALMSRKYKYSYLSLLVPAVAIVAFWSHPVGRHVWYFALFWLIPIIAYFKRDLVFARALGATMTAHAVGGALWIWFVPTTTVYWNNLIPIVIRERFVFALGMMLCYLALDSVLNYLVSKKKLSILRTLQPALS